MLPIILPGIDLIFLNGFPSYMSFLSWKALGRAKTSANADGHVGVVFLFLIF